MLEENRVRTIGRGRRWLVAALVAAVFVGESLAASAAALKPRPAAPKDQTLSVPAEVPVARIVVKFQEGSGVRLRRGGLAVDRQAAEPARARRAGLSDVGLARDLAALEVLVSTHPKVVELRRLFSLPEEELARLKATGEGNSGRELADLDLYYQLTLSKGTHAGAVAELVARLNALPSVEVAYAEPPSRLTDDPSLVPDLSGHQGYLLPAPLGVDAYYAWTIPGGSGAGAKVVDVERGWNLGHVDMSPNVIHLSGSWSPFLADRNHGTAALGVIAARNNSQGMTGIAYDAQIGASSSYDPDGTGPEETPIADAVTRAALAAGGGGLVLVEVERLEVFQNGIPLSCLNPNSNIIGVYLPIEYWQAEFDAIGIATSNGTLVVEAAANGGVNLDCSIFNNRFDRSQRDSGAFLVAASRSQTREPWQNTNWGSRIDLHGWGEGVATLGYGDLWGTAENYYFTGGFSGTSSASAIVAGAVLSTQGVRLARSQPLLTPEQALGLLSTTGTPQVPGPKNIGPMPNLRSALDRIIANQPPVPRFEFVCNTVGTCDFNAFGSTDDFGIASYSWDFGDFQHGTGPVVTHTLAAGASTVTLVVTDNLGISASISRVVSVQSGFTAPTSKYFKLPPCRLVDTRSTKAGPLANGETRTFALAGCGVPVDAKAVSMNATVVSPSGDGSIILFEGTLNPALATLPTLSFGTSTSPRANNAVVRTWGATTVAAKAQVAGAGSVHLILDVEGYFSDAASPAPGATGPLGFQPLTPCRIEDTRTTTPLTAGFPRTFDVQGRCGIPSGAAAAALNATAVGPTSGGHLVLYAPPAGSPPGVSMLNFNAGTGALANGLRGPLGASPGDFVAIFSSIGGATTHLLLDTTGYFQTGAPRQYRALSLPCRAVDTRSLTTQGPALVPGQLRKFQIQGNCGVPSGAKAVFAEVSVVAPTVAGHLVVFPEAEAQPDSSLLNFPGGEPWLTNGAILPLSPLSSSTRDLAVTMGAVAAGQTHLVIDVLGYFE